MLFFVYMEQGGATPGTAWELFLFNAGWWVLLAPSGAQGGAMLGITARVPTYKKSILDNEPSWEIFS